MLTAVLTLVVFNSFIIGLGENSTSLYPRITVFVYPDSTVELVYVLSGYLPLELNISSGYIDYTLNYNEDNNTVLLAVTGGGELVYGEPAGAPVNHSIVFIGLSTDTRINPEDKTLWTLGVLIVNADERVNGVPSHLTLNASRIIIDSEPESINLSFILEIKGNTNLSLLDKFLGYDLSELNSVLVSKGFDWIEITDYNTSSYNNTYRITGSLTINLSMLLDKILNQSMLSEGQVDEMRACIENLYSNASIWTRLTQAYWSEEYGSARRIGLKTEFTLTLHGDTSILDNIASCLPVYARLLSLMPPNSPNITIPRIDFDKYTWIPGLTHLQPYPFHVNVRLDFIRSGIKFNLTVDSGRLLYNATNLPPNMRLERALEVVKDYLENLTALLEPYRIMLGVEHLVPTTISVKSVSVNGLKVLVEPETIELFKPIKLNVSIMRIQPTTATTLTQIESTKTLTTTVTVTETVKKNFTVTKTLEYTTTITKPTVIQKTVTETIRAIDTRTLIVSVIMAVAVSVSTTYILMRRKTKTTG